MSVTTLNGRNVVITGAIDGHTRTSAAAVLAQAGAHVQSSVTRATDVLIVGNSPGATKLDGAQKWSVPTITWGDAIALIRGGAPVRPTVAPTAAPTRNQPVAAQPNYRQVAPMLCKKAEGLPTTGEWIYEVKWDGYRCVAHVNGTTILASRRGKDYARFTQIIAELDQLTVPCILDGEIVVLDEEGRSEFWRLHKGDIANAKFVAFDVLEAMGTDVRDQPLSARKELLADILEAGVYVTVSPTFEDGEELLAYASDNDLEGIVAKRAGSRYQEGARNESWLKIKLRQEQEFVVVGFTPGKGNRKGVPGAALLAVNEGTKTRPKWLYCGSVGSGGSYDDWAALEEAATPSPAHVFLPKDMPRLKADFTGPEFRHVTWVEPTLVVQVKFQRWTDDGKLWHPSMQGVRSDKNPKEVTKE